MHDLQAGIQGWGYRWTLPLSTLPQIFTKKYNLQQHLKSKKKCRPRREHLIWQKCIKVMKLRKPEVLTKNMKRHIMRMHNKFIQNQLQKVLWRCFGRQREPYIHDF